MTRHLVEQEARARVGELVGDRYELVRLIGCGGCGAVYEARHRNTRGRLAVKLMLAAGGDEGARRRFEREARVLTRLSHPHIVRVFDLGAHGDALYLAEELIEGETLRERLAKRAALSKRGGLSPREAREVALPLLDALDYAHLRGVVHRDVKPENVLISRSESGALRPVLIDFGVARVDDPDEARTRTGAVIGTPAYMAPEQCLSAAGVDARADLWALGAVLFECLSARPPFEGSPTETLSALLTLPAPSLAAVCPDAPPPLVALVDASLSRAPARRPQSARAFADGLRACGELSDEPLAHAASAIERETARETQASTVSSSTVGSSTAPPAPRPRRAGAALLASLVALAAVALVRASWISRTAPKTSPPRVIERVSAAPTVEAPVVSNVAARAPTAPVEVTPRATAPLAARPRARAIARAPSREATPVAPLPTPSRGANRALILEP